MCIHYSTSECVTARHNASECVRVLNEFRDKFPKIVVGIHISVINAWYNIRNRQSFARETGAFPGVVRAKFFSFEKKLFAPSAELRRDFISAKWAKGKKTAFPSPPGKASLNSCKQLPPLESPYPAQLPRGPVAARQLVGGSKTPMRARLLTSPTSFRLVRPPRIMSAMLDTHSGGRALVCRVCANDVVSAPRAFILCPGRGISAGLRRRFVSAKPLAPFGGWFLRGRPPHYICAILLRPLRRPPDFQIL